MNQKLHEISKLAHVLSRALLSPNQRCLVISRDSRVTLGLISGIMGTANLPCIIKQESNAICATVRLDNGSELILRRPDSNLRGYTFQDVFIDERVELSGEVKAMIQSRVDEEEFKKLYMGEWTNLDDKEKQ